LLVPKSAVNVVGKALSNADHVVEVVSFLKMTARYAAGLKEWTAIIAATQG